MNNIFISYIIPCYNIQSYLQTCFNSLVKQRVCDNIDVEFIFVNDGSTDNTLSILKEFKLKDSRVTVLDQPNQGVSSARNNGLKYAKGDYVFFLDSDDSLTDDTSLLMYKLYNEYKPDIIVGVCGCMAQEENVVNILKKYDFVNIVFGTHNIRLPARSAGRTGRRG